MSLVVSLPSWYMHTAAMTLAERIMAHLNSSAIEKLVSLFIREVLEEV